ncbi:MAG: hypothetical protein ACR2N3_07050 [Pyrinomonadaceae bacterium]
MRKFSISLLVAFVATLSAIHGQNSDSRKEAERIWELAIQAKGGREKLYAVENMLVSSRFTVKHGVFKKKDARYDQFFVFPSKLWIWNDALPEGVGLLINTINLETQTVYFLYPTDLKNPLRKNNEIYESDKQYFRYTQLLFLLESRWQKPKIIGYRIDFIGSQKYDVVETVLDNGMHDIFFDQKTHLPVRIVFHYRGTLSDKTTNYIYKLEDYQTIDGITLPTKLYAPTAGAAEYLSFQINVEYDKSIFEKPPTAEAGSEAWKLKK